MYLRSMHKSPNRTRTLSPYEKGVRNPNFINPTFISTAFDFAEIHNNRNHDTSTKEQQVNTPNALIKSQQSNYFTRQDSSQINSMNKTRSISQIATQADKTKKILNEQLKQEQLRFQQEQDKALLKLQLSNNEISMNRLQQIIKEDGVEQDKHQMLLKEANKSYYQRYTKQLENNISFKQQAKQDIRMQDYRDCKQIENAVQFGMAEQSIMDDLSKYKKQCFTLSLDQQNQHKQNMKILRQKMSIKDSIIAQQQSQQSLLKEQQLQLQQLKSKYQRQL